MRVLVFGDSITQGYWDTEGGWVNMLRKHYDEIQASDLENKDEPTIFNLGVSADTSKDILDRVESETLARTRHGDLPIVIVQIGINDSMTTNGKYQVPLEDYRSNLEAIIKKLSGLSSKLIFVGSNPVVEERTDPVFWGDFRYLNKGIKSYENVMEEVAKEYNISFIPVFDEFLERVSAGDDLLPDGLHPNNAGHKVIFEITKSKLESLLA